MIVLTYKLMCLTHTLGATGSNQSWLPKEQVRIFVFFFTFPGHNSVMFQIIQDPVSTHAARCNISRESIQFYEILQVCEVE